MTNTDELSARPKDRRRAWTWVPSLYFAEGLPYVVVMSLSTIFFKRMGMSNGDLALYTSWLYLPWTLKCIWSPVVDILKTKRWWIVTMQALVALSLAGVAFSVPAARWVQLSLACFWLMAFESATHDIAADGFYMHALGRDTQAFFIGIRNTFYRLAMIFGQGILVMLAGVLENRAANFLEMEPIRFAWLVCFAVCALIFAVLAAYHFYVLPRPNSDAEANKTSDSPALTFGAFWVDFGRSFVSFFQKKHILIALAFMLLYRFSEAQLVKLTTPFLLDTAQDGGLGMSTASVGFAYGTIGVMALVLGGILGGIVISRRGLRRSLWPMALAISLPNAVYLLFALFRPEQSWMVYSGIALEQFGYGYGFTAYTMYLLQFCEGRFKTAHYALCTAFMSLGMMIPGMFAGKLQEAWGYPLFFGWIMLCTLPCFAVVALARRQLPTAPSASSKSADSSHNA